MGTYILAVSFLESGCKGTHSRGFMWNNHWVAMFYYVCASADSPGGAGDSVNRRTVLPLSPSARARDILGPDPINNVWRITTCTVIYRRHVAELSRGQAKFTNRRPFDSLVAAAMCFAAVRSDSPRFGLRSLVRGPPPLPLPRLKYESR